MGKRTQLTASLSPFSRKSKLIEHQLPLKSNPRPRKRNSRKSR